ncbi:MAG: hypothetical protein ACLGI6_05435 [Gammaproteobacteria bacterium]
MKHLLIITGLGVALAAPLCASAESVDVATLSESKVALQEVATKAEGKAFLAVTLINAPMARLCAIIQDYAAYPGFMPSVSKTVVTRGSSSDTLVDMSLKLPLGKTKQYRLKMTPATTPQQCRLAWKLVPTPGLKPEETIADTDGYWQLAPAANGRTAVQYYVYTNPGPVPLGAGWIVESMSKDSLPKTLEALRAKAAQQH